MIGEAYAMGGLPQQGGQGSAGGMGILIQFAPIILIFGVFYFLLIRPQQKKQKETTEMLANLKKGNKVVTSGGAHGIIMALGEDTVTLKIADKTNVIYQRSAIASLSKK